MINDTLLNVIMIKSLYLLNASKVNQWSDLDGSNFNDYDKLCI